MKSGFSSEPHPSFGEPERDVSAWAAAHGVTLLRISIGVVFFWFGALKLIPGLSPAEGLAGETIFLLTGGRVEPGVSVPVLGLCECLIGAGLLSGVALRLTIAALFLHMCGTVTPAVVLPDHVFAGIPFVLTMEGQYIVKNLVLISGGLVVGAAAAGCGEGPKPTAAVVTRSGRSRSPDTPSGRPRLPTGSGGSAPIPGAVRPRRRAS